VNRRAPVVTRGRPALATAAATISRERRMEGWLATQQGDLSHVVPVGTTITTPEKSHRGSFAPTEAKTRTGRETITYEAIALGRDVIRPLM